MMENYFAIQQLLYNNKFDYTIDIPDELKEEPLLIPPMLTQPFIENAIKHGLKDKITGGRIQVRFYFKSAKLYFEITDNGKGFAQQETDNHKSLALKITKERLMYTSGNIDFSVKIENQTDTENKVIGAKVSFEIPYLYEN